MKLNRILEVYADVDIDSDAKNKSVDDDISNTEAWIANSQEWMGELKQQLKDAVAAGDDDEAEDIKKDIEYYQNKIKEKRARLAQLKK